MACSQPAIPLPDVVEAHSSQLLEDHETDSGSEAEGNVDLNATDIDEQLGVQMKCTAPCCDLEAAVSGQPYQIKAKHYH